MLQYVADSKELRRRATYDDLIAVPDHLVAEIIDGELITSPRPASRHALAGSSLVDELVSPFQKARRGPGGWWILGEPELHFGADVLVPDLAGWRRERMPEFVDVPFFTLAPDWVCEVLSPSTARLDRTKKLGIYAREHIPYAWFVEPVAKTVEVFVLSRSEWILRATHGGQDRIRAVPFDAIEIELAHLWGEAPAAPDSAAAALEGAASKENGA